jgi:hypothetical protein
MHCNVAPTGTHKRVAITMLCEAIRALHTNATHGETETKQ